jgi:RimJ/RimL family protein N-acetyltransferase
MIATPRLRLRPWGDDHRAAFAAMNADPQVMADLGGPIDCAESDASWLQAHGLSRWAVEDARGQFLGYAGAADLTALGSSADSISVGVEDVSPDDWMGQVYEPEMTGKLDSLYKRPGYGPLK